jgi:hypothetical protein
VNSVKVQSLRLLADKHQEVCKAHFKLVDKQKINHKWYNSVVMPSKSKLSPHKHTGRKLPHHHTSYASLAFLVMLCGLVLSAVTLNASAYEYGDPNPGPFAGSVGLSGKVSEPPPTVAAVITRPSNGQRFGATPITVSGTCPKDTIVELFKNDIFAGATTCKDDKTFGLEIDLLYGSNTLVARVFDALDQAGPDSNNVTVFYDALPAQAAPLNSSNLNDIQLILRSSPVYRGTFPSQEFKLPLEIISGTPPFALNIDWGDNKSDLLSRSDNLAFSVPHTYTRPGSYQVTIKATDAKGRLAFLTVLVIVNGRAETTGGTQTPTTPSKNMSLLIAWPLFVVLILLIISFWLGERREKHKLEISGALA